MLHRGPIFGHEKSPQQFSTTFWSTVLIKIWITSAHSNNLKVNQNFNLTSDHRFWIEIESFFSGIDNHDKIVVSVYFHIVPNFGPHSSMTLNQKYICEPTLFWTKNYTFTNDIQF